MKRIGIFSGTFDPVHKGHIAFALKAAESAELDEVYLVPEPLPRSKQGVTHLSHRLAMLQLATRAHRKLHVLELPDKRFDTLRTWPRLKQRFEGDQLLLLVGGDVFETMSGWPHVNLLLRDAGVVVGTRSSRDIAQALHSLVALNQILWETHIIESQHPEISSRLIRSAIARGQVPDTLLASVHRYIQENWLYVDIRTLVSK